MPRSAAGDSNPAPTAVARRTHSAMWKNAANTSPSRGPSTDTAPMPSASWAGAALTRGLFLDRRAFLVSYDATQDPADESLAALMAAVVPVCAGISLEYYFSFVDNDRYGCGTKLPHNVTGLVGVMDGHASDLRTGLPWQMVEIHEPVRILFVDRDNARPPEQGDRRQPILKAVGRESLDSGRHHRPCIGTRARPQGQRL